MPLTIVWGSGNTAIQGTINDPNNDQLNGYTASCGGPANPEPLDNYLYQLGTCVQTLEGQVGGNFSVVAGSANVTVAEAPTGTFTIDVPGGTETDTTLSRQTVGGRDLLYESEASQDVISRVPSIAINNFSYQEISTVGFGTLFSTVMAAMPTHTETLTNPLTVPATPVIMGSIRPALGFVGSNGSFHVAATVDGVLVARANANTNFQNGGGMQQIFHAPASNVVPNGTVNVTFQVQNEITSDGGSTSASVFITHTYSVLWIAGVI